MRSLGLGLLVLAACYDPFAGGAARLTLQAAARSCERVDLSWEQLPEASRYRLQRGEAVLATVAGDAQSFIDADRQPGVTYRYTVTALDDDDGEVSQDAAAVTRPACTPSYLDLEAEDAALTAPMESGADPLASSGAFVHSPGILGAVKFSFDVVSTGTYTVWARVLAPDSSTDSLFVLVDDAQGDIYDTAEGLWSSAWQWTVVNGRGGTGVQLTLNPRTFELEPGPHTLSFITREPESALDRIVITDDASFVPGP
jgi:hypothetical protein